MRTKIQQCFTLLVLLTIITSCSQKRKKIGTLQEYGLNGDVWQVIEHPYEGSGKIEEFKVSEIDKYNWQYPHKLMEFAKDGYLKKRCEIDWDEDIDDCVFQTRENNLIIRESKEDTNEIAIQDNGTRAEFLDTIRTGVTVDYKQEDNIDIYKINDNGHKYSIELKLNDNGQIINRYRIDSTGKRHMLSSLDYNSNGHISRKKEFSSDNDSLIQETVYLYEYDEHNNWTQKAIFKNKEFVVAIRRDIKYYSECFKDFKRVDLIGMWKKEKSERWIEFFKDGKIDVGRGSSIRKSGTWELDEKSQRITFRIDDGGTKYDYKFSKCNLILSDPTDEDDFDVYSKVTDKK